MRTAIACHRCRKAKVKCKHNGLSPCEACIRGGTETSCVLTGPPTKRQGSISHASATTRRRHPRQAISPGPIANQVVRIPDAIAGLSSLLAAVPQQTLARSLRSFRTQFPEYGFMHPSDLDVPRDQLSDAGIMKLLAIVAVCRRYSGGNDPLGAECAATVMQHIQSRLNESPCLELIQTVLIMALHQWGEGEGYSAWMNTGIAIRMTQVTLVSSLSTQDPRPAYSNTAKPAFEKEIRTVWTCFVLDRLLSCGKQRPAGLMLDDVRVPRPGSDEEFAFGASEPRGSPATPNDPRLALEPVSNFRIIVDGIEIWSKIHGWVVEGGRKHPGMTEPEQCPWQPKSHWACMRSDLEAWRKSQHITLRYPETRITTHIHLRRGEGIAYINLIYYLSIVFLCREYIPFLPQGELGPRGPLDLPRLKDTAPDGFWEGNAAELFTAVEHMTNIMRSLRDADSSVYTPFTGLCAFTSALMNLYGAAFPNMTGKKDTTLATLLAKENMIDLKRISELWKLGKEWLDVVDTAQTLYSQMSSTNEQLVVMRSRDNYPDLESSINLAKLKGLPSRETHPSLEPQPQHYDATETMSTTNEQHPASQPPSDIFSNFEVPDIVDTSLETDRMGMNEDSWRLWSFWDNNHFLAIE